MGQKPVILGGVTSFGDKTHPERVAFEEHQGHPCCNQCHIWQRDVMLSLVTSRHMHPSHKRAVHGSWGVLLPETSKSEVLRACV